jgi:hypothetical protein
MTSEWIGPRSRSPGATASEIIDLSTTVKDAATVVRELSPQGPGADTAVAAVGMEALMRGSNTTEEET